MNILHITHLSHSLESNFFKATRLLDCCTYLTLFNCGTIQHGRAISEKSIQNCKFSQNHRDSNSGQLGLSSLKWLLYHLCYPALYLDCGYSYVKDLLHIFIQHLYIKYTSLTLITLNFKTSSSIQF